VSLRWLLVGFKIGYRLGCTTRAFHCGGAFTPRQLEFVDQRPLPNTLFGIPVIETDLRPSGIVALKTGECGSCGLIWHPSEIEDHICPLCREVIS